MPQTEIARLAQQLAALLSERGQSLTCAESCTGGMLSAALTDIPGSSAWFGYGFVTYSNQAKQDLLGVQAETLARVGAVSETTVREMAAGALACSHADWALAVSGIAGPGGGTPDKPVGQVWLALAVADGATEAWVCQFAGTRQAVRQQAVCSALQRLILRLQTGHLVV